METRVMVHNLLRRRGWRLARCLPRSDPIRVPAAAQRNLASADHVHHANAAVGADMDMDATRDWGIPDTRACPSRFTTNTNASADCCTHAGLPLFHRPNGQQRWRQQRRVMRSVGGSVARFHNSRLSSASSPAAAMPVQVTHSSATDDSNIGDIDIDVDPTQLVESLFQRTRMLMDGAQQHIIAYSGGVDSALVATLVHRVATPEETVQAVLGLSPAVPAEQVSLAEHVASTIGFDLDQIPTTEGGDDVYIENSGQACLACKTHLYTCLDAIIAKHGNGNDDRRLYNGTNADDVQDPTRLGLIAANNFNVRSPLVQIPKHHVRIAAKHLGLPNWNYAASPCLRSRLALGVEAVPEHLQRIEQAERYVRAALHLDATRNMRVRLLTNNRAMVEVESAVLSRAQEAATNHVSWEHYFVNELGFASVNVRAFKSGSVATKSGDD